MGYCHLVQKHMDEERFYVTEAVTGKQKRTTRLRYHAKGRMGMMTKDTTQLTIKLEEKPIEYMYKEMINGKTPPMLAYMIKKRLVAMDVDYETIKKNTFMLTAKGRQQRRLMFKRKVIQRVRDFKKDGVSVTYNLMAKKLLEDEANEYSAIYRASKLATLTSGIAQRQTVFNRNQELTK